MQQTTQNENDMKKVWQKDGVITSYILKGDLNHTHEALLKLTQLSNLENFVIQTESMAVVIPKDKSEKMIHKVLWLSSITGSPCVQAVRKGVLVGYGSKKRIDFDTYNRRLDKTLIRYIPIDSKQR